MKPLALAVLCLAPVLASAQARRVPEPAGVPALRPALYARFAAGPGGYTVKQIVKNIDWTQKNLDGLVDYLEPWQTGVAAPRGQDAADAQKDLLSESAACAKLIAEGQALLDKGIERAAEPSGPLRAVFLFPSKPMRPRLQPAVAELQRDVATAQVNVAGHMGSLIELRSEHEAEPAEEAKAKEWLDSAGKYLAAAEKRLADARDAKAGAGAHEAGQKAIGAAPEAPKAALPADGRSR